MFFVTAVDGARVWLLAGPYAEKEAAEAAVSAARGIACDAKRNASAARAWFFSYGVSRWKDADSAPPRSILGVV